MPPQQRREAQGTSASLLARSEGVMRVWGLGRGTPLCWYRLATLAASPLVQ